MAIQLMHRCPKCGSPLEVFEFEGWILYGCYKCLKYVRMDYDEAKEAFFSGGRFDWRGLIDHLHHSYMAYYYRRRR
ncbi:MAG: zf-TFIIB domain-containing protein [Thermofilaceae archaeon]